MSLAMPTTCMMPDDPRNCVHAKFQDVGRKYYVWCHRFIKQNVMPCKRYDEHWNLKQKSALDAKGGK